MYSPVSQSEFETITELAAWKFEGEKISITLPTANFSAAGSLAAQIAALADEVNHHPDLMISYPGLVKVVLTTHDRGGVTDADVELARQIMQLK